MTALPRSHPPRRPYHPCRPCRPCRPAVRRWLLSLAVLAASAVAVGGAAGQRPSSPEPPDQARYAASSEGRVYYWIGCADRWRRLAPTNLRFFDSADAVEAAGYVPSSAVGCGRQPLSADPAAPADVAMAGRCVVARIVDGDTLVCATGDRIRLLLIDAPELSQGEYGARARAALEALLPVGAEATVELDVRPRDRYGRILAYLYTADGLLVNEEIVRLGLAVVAVHPPDVRHLDRLRAAAEEARAAGRGLWSADGLRCAPAAQRRGDC